MEDRNLLKMKKIIKPMLVILVAALLRFLPHIPNMAPIAAMALFGGVYLDKKYALFLPIVVMLLSDMFLGFHNTMPFVYGSFLLTGLIGINLKKHNNFKSIVGGALLSSILFFVITNFGVWMMNMGNMYPKTMVGLAQCFVMAIPFFRNTIMGDLFYSGMFFGGYKVAVGLIQKAEAKV
jgi:hypothetical protein